MANTYSEFSFYSPIHDCTCVRLSVSDGRTGEFFVIIPAPVIGKKLREDKEKALNAIEAVIDSYTLRGEVPVGREIHVDFTPVIKETSYAS